MPRVGKRTKYSKDKALKGVYRDGDDPKADLVVFRSCGTGKLKASTKEQRFLWNHPVADLKVASAQHYIEAQKLSKLKGTVPEKGQASGDFARYFQKRANGTKKRGHGPFTKSELANRTFILDWWKAIIGTRKLTQLTQDFFLDALATLTRTDGQPVTDSYKDKFASAMSNVYTVLFGAAGINPLRGIGKFEGDVNEGVHREQPYYVVDGLFAHMRDRGQAGKPSRTKALLKLEAYGGVERGDVIRSDVKRDIEWAPRDGDAPDLCGRIWIAKRSKTGVRIEGKGSWQPLDADGLAALQDCVDAECIGRKDPTDPTGKTLLYPSHSAIYKTFVLARTALLAALQDDPNLPEDVDLAKVATMRPKDLRHSYGDRVQMTGGNIESTRRMMRHAKDSPMTHRYVETAEQKQADKDFGKFAAAQANRKRYVKVTTAASQRKDRRRA